MRKNIYIFVVTLFMGMKNVWKWLMALLDVLGVFTYPTLSTFAFSGLCSGFFLSIVSYPIHGWDRVGFWIGVTFGTMSVAAVIFGSCRYLLDRDVKTQKPRRLRAQDQYA